jgi:hypothetical protein
MRLKNENPTNSKSFSKTFYSQTYLSVSLLQNVQTGPWTQPAYYPMSTGKRGSFLGVKRPGREDAYSLTFSAIKVKLSRYRQEQTLGVQGS